MRMFKTEQGQIVIDGDEQLLKKIEGESLDGVGIIDQPVDADRLAKAYVKADATKAIHDIKVYAVMKEQYIATYSTPVVEEAVEESPEEEIEEPSAE